MSYYQYQYDKWSFALFIPCLYPSLYEPYDPHYNHAYNQSYWQQYNEPSMPQHYASSTLQQQMPIKQQDFFLNTLCDYVLKDDLKENIVSPNGNTGFSHKQQYEEPNAQQQHQRQASTSPKPKFIAPRFEKKWLENHQQKVPLSEQQSNTNVSVVQQTNKYKTSAPVTIMQKQKQHQQQQQSLSTSSSSTASSGYGSLSGSNSPPASATSPTQTYYHKKRRNYYGHHHQQQRPFNSIQNTSTSSKRCKCNYNCNCAASTSATSNNNKYRLSNVQKSRT